MHYVSCNLNVKYINATGSLYVTEFLIFLKLKPFMVVLIQLCADRTGQRVRNLLYIYIYVTLADVGVCRWWRTVMSSSPSGSS